MNLWPLHLIVNWPLFTIYICCFIIRFHGKNTIRYLRVYLVSFKTFRCAIDNAKKSFYRSFNPIFGKVGRSASELVMVELLKTKCLSVLLYGLEVCSTTKVHIRSMDYAISSCYRKIFNVKFDANVWFCMDMFNSVDVHTMLLMRC